MEMSADEILQDLLAERKVAEPESPVHITFADMGIPTSDYLQGTSVVKTRPFGDISRTERVYLLLMLASIATTSTLSAYRLAILDIWSADFTLCLVLLINSGFSMLYVIEGVLRERMSEIIILTLATSIVLVYMGINYKSGLHDPVKQVRLILACVFYPSLVILGPLVAWGYFVSRRLVFRTVGASETLQSCYITLLAFQDCLKFDLQLTPFGVSHFTTRTLLVTPLAIVLTSSMVVFAVSSTRDIGLMDLVIFSVDGGIALAWFLLGYISMPRESKFGSYLFFLLSSAEIAYIVFNLQNIFKKEIEYSEISISHLACLTSGLVVHLVAMVTGIAVFNNFGKGLKEKLHERPRAVANGTYATL